MFGVEHHQTPVATSNGWGDDKGIAPTTEAERDAVMSLFNKRKTQRQVQRGAVQWMNAARRCSQARLSGKSSVKSTGVYGDGHPEADWASTEVMPGVECNLSGRSIWGRKDRIGKLA